MRGNINRKVNGYHEPQYGITLQVVPAYPEYAPVNHGQHCQQENGSRQHTKEADRHDRDRAAYELDERTDQAQARGCKQDGKVFLHCFINGNTRYLIIHEKQQHCQGEDDKNQLKP